MRYSYFYSDSVKLGKVTVTGVKRSSENTLTLDSGIKYAEFSIDSDKLATHFVLSVVKSVVAARHLKNPTDSELELVESQLNYCIERAFSADDDQIREFSRVIMNAISCINSGESKHVLYGVDKMNGITTDFYRILSPGECKVCGFVEFPDQGAYDSNGSDITDLISMLNAMLKCENDVRKAFEVRVYKHDLGSSCLDYGWVQIAHRCIADSDYSSAATSIIEDVVDDSIRFTDSGAAQKIIQAASKTEHQTRQNVVQPIEMDLFKKR